MSNRLIQIFQQSELNKVILNTLANHEGKMGTFTSEDKETEIPDATKTQMDEVINEMCIVLKSLNTMFIEKNITSDSSMSYVEFLCDLLPKYFLAPTFDNLSKLSPLEIETIAEASVSETSIEEMKEGLIENALANQSLFTLEQIQEQYKEYDDGTIQAAYKTLLMKQYQIAVSTPAQ